jgi:nucleotide-binding universal stress UspA family protein
MTATLNLIDTVAPASAHAARATEAPILVASDGTESAARAMQTAGMLTRATGSPVQVVSVLEPVSMLAPAPLLVGLPPDIDQTRAADKLNEVRDQRREAGGDASWSIEVKYGDPATTITRTAKERSARMLVMGLNRHGTMDRVLGGDTVFDVVRLGETPVLVATEPMHRSPRVIVVGVDFGSLSVRAAQLAVDLFPEATDVYLVHVAPTIDVTIEGWYDLTYARSTRESFAQMVCSLDGCSARIQTVELVGNRERELTRFARGLKADLLVVGSYRRGLFRRLATGTMAARVLRGSPCPVLIVPDPGGEVMTPVSAANGARHPELADTVKEVTRRNTGRRAVVEIDSPTIGAQALAFDYCFLGMDYDHHSDRVHIYLGEMGDGGARHITHSVGAPRSVDVLRAMDGRDQVVRIADGSGQALVTFW